MNSYSTSNRYFTCFVHAMMGLSAMVLALLPVSSTAQDNPLPLNYRNLTVTVVEINNNQRRNIGGAKVRIEPRNPDNAARPVKFPQTKTTQGNSGQARFSKLPPSKEVGPYTVLISTKDCGEQKKTFNKNGGSDQRLQITFNRCGNAAAAQRESERRAQGGYKLQVDLKLATGRPGGGLWVYLYGPDNKLIKRQRTSSGGGNTRFNAIQPGRNYTLEVKMGSKTVLKEKFDMPASNESLAFTVQ